ncbi:MAG: penicillin-binding protein activator [Holosporales bacterium]|jgi:ABC-type branched-subunit amino acid transport system substrate-binding protein|nr:penicillin-binding protein activator [Holosporales bacterium]
MQHNKCLFFGLVASLLFFLSGCDSEPDGTTIHPIPPRAAPRAAPPAVVSHEEIPSSFVDREPQKPIAGLMLPLSGQYAPLGEALLNTSMLAFAELGIDTCRIRVVDTQGTPTGARNAAKALAVADAKIVLGPLFAQEVQAAAPLLAKYNVPMIVFSNTPKVARENVFVFGLNPEDEIIALLTFGFARSANHFAAVIPEGTYGETVLRTINIALAGRQQHIFATDTHQRTPQLDVIRYRPGETNPKELAQKCATLSFEAVIVLETDSVIAPMLVRALKKQQETALILGPSAWKEPAFSFLPEMEGVYIALPSQEGGEAFFKRYRKTFAKDPIFPLGLLAFDAITALAQITDFSNLTHQWFVKEGNFLGLSGEYSFEKTGKVHRPLHVYQLKGQDIVPVRDPLNED